MYKIAIRFTVVSFLYLFVLPVPSQGDRPPAPTSFSASEAGNGVITLSWSAHEAYDECPVKDYTYFSSSDNYWRPSGFIYDKVGGEKNWRNWVKLGARTDAIVPGLSTGHYEFALVAFTECGYSDTTYTSLSITVESDEEDPPPVEDEEDGSVRNVKFETYAEWGLEGTLSWDPPASDGGSDVLRYEYSSDGVNWESTGKDTNVFISRLVKGKEYTYYVRAVTAAGNSGIKSTTFTITTPPGSVLNLKASAGWDPIITLTWDVPSSDGGTPILWYEYNVDGGPWTRTDDMSVTVDVSHLHSADRTFFTFRVRAVNKHGSDFFPSRTTVTIPFWDEPIPRKVRNLRGEITGFGEVTLAWDPPEYEGLFDESKPVMGYIVGYRESGSTADVVWFNDTVTETSAILRGLSVTTYTFFVFAYNSAGGGLNNWVEVDVTAGESSQPASGEPGNQQPPGGSVEAQPPGEPENQRTPAGSVEVQSSDEPESQQTPEDSVEVQTSDEPESQQPPEDSVEVQSSDEPENQDSETVPGEVKDLIATALNRRVILSWDAPENDGGSPVTSYEYKINAGDWNEVEGGADARTQVIRGLRNGVRYEFYVRAVNDAGSGVAAIVSAVPGRRASKPVVGDQADEELSVVAVPNPFNPATVIRVQMPVSATVSLKVYNVTGQLVRTLWHDHALSAGSHAIRWDSRNDWGHPVASGVYLYVLQTPEQVLMNKMILIR